VKKRGFTLIELLIVVAILIIISVVVVVNLAGKKLNADLVSTTQQIVTTLRQAQSDSMAQEKGMSWGVHFDNSTTTTPFFALFSGSYATGTISGHYPLPSTVAYSTSTLASGATLDIIFSQITGAASASTSIGLYMPKESTALSSTIAISSLGFISSGAE
jgi:prepilin-type N-terminal cleavage/methylation domain-containing protein